MAYHINPDLLTASQEMAGGLLTVPPDARIGRGDQKRWTERLVYEGSEIFEGEQADNPTVRLNFRVSPAGVGSLNLNRRVSSRNNLDFNAQQGSGRYIMTAISLSRLTAFLRACGVEVPAGGFQLEEFFGPTSFKVLHGTEVMGLVTDKPDRDDKTIRRQEITNFVPVED